jgi:hypothetical protein
MRDDPNVSKGGLPVKQILLALIALVMLLASPGFARDSSPYITVDTTWPIQSRFVFNFGTPGGLNLGFSYWHPSGAGFRITGGAIPSSEGNEAVGFQGELVLRIHESGKTVSDLSLGAGYSRVTSNYDENKWNYFGAFYNLNSRSLFLQVGLSAGSGDYSSPQICFQIGVSLFTTRRR